MGAIGIPGGLYGESPVDFLTRKLTFTAGTFSRRVVATHVVRLTDTPFSHVLYAAVHVTDPARNLDAVEALLARYVTARDNGTVEFLYDIESEDAGPYLVTCPLAILDKLTPLPPPPTDGSHDPARTARTWREKCRAHAAAESAARPALRPGDRVIFNTPWALSNGTTDDTFTVERHTPPGKTRSNLAFRSAKAGILCLLDHWHRTTYCVDRPEPTSLPPLQSTTTQLTLFA